MLIRCARRSAGCDGAWARRGSWRNCCKQGPIYSWRSAMAQSDPTVPSTRLAGDTADKVATLREDQRQQWAQGRRPVVEDYLALEPALAQNAEAILELICQEMVLREQHNDPPHREDYQRRFPGLARELAIQFELHEAVRDKVLPGLEGRLEAEPAAPELPGLEILGVLGQGGMGV